MFLKYYDWAARQLTHHPIASKPETGLAGAMVLLAPMIPIYALLILLPLSSRAEWIALILATFLFFVVLPVHYIIVLRRERRK